MEINKQVQAVIYDKIANKIRLLLVKKIDLKNSILRWRLLKGSVEENEDEKKALAREISEEVGLTKITIGEKIQEHEFEFHGVINKVQTFIVKVDSSQRIKVQTTELADAGWVPVEDAKKILFFEPEKKAVEIFSKYKY